MYQWQPHYIIAKKARLGYRTLRYFDEKFEFTTGNATPKGEPEWILENGVKMYHELSPKQKNSSILWSTVNY